jgi:hypothetical protein
MVRRRSTVRFRNWAPNYATLFAPGFRTAARLGYLERNLPQNLVATSMSSGMPAAQRVISILYR